MKINKFKIILSNKDKVILFLFFYIFLTELLKIKAEVYVIEHSIELKLLVFSVALVLMYKISDRIIVSGILFLLLLSVLNLPTGLMIYVLVIAAFTKLLMEIK